MKETIIVHFFYSHPNVEDSKLLIHYTEKNEFILQIR